MNEMKYKFLIPKMVKIDTSKAIIIHGGMCPSVNVIYIYGFNTVNNSENNGDACLYDRLLEHEHLHSILHRFGVPLKHHEIILDNIHNI